MKKLSIVVMLFFALISVPTISQAADCPSIAYWDGVELKSGQIGRVLIQKSTTIYKNVNGKFEFSRTVKPGENYRIYAKRSTYYHLGGGLVILDNADVLYQTPSKSKVNQLNCVKTALSIGDNKTTATAKLGTQKTALINEFGASTSIYHNNYNSFYAISYLSNKIASIYTKDKSYQVNGVSVSNTIGQLENKLGTKYETTGNTYPIEIITYNLPEYEANFFIDVHNDNKIAAIYLIDHLLIDKNPNLYPKKSITLETSYEALLFQLTNAERKAHGVEILQSSSKVANVARNHSVDMGLNDYFNHDNLKGESPFDRLSNSGVQFRNGGENIAMGYTSPYFAHEALMNSLGHRKNIISTAYTQLGVGVYFADWTHGSIPYYTENFIKP
ncbi:CAP domain-containing protein [Psychrobacillus antarcticus]|uniref:CAP domain-containing protein n=1 Tax=Psychrobacillus antarcticus TaxID=2879115 RepID=UPI0024085794|nr:CAP domain-containing protein [Psychrobacillus antarcticus]